MGRCNPTKIRLSFGGKVIGYFPAFSMLLHVWSDISLELWAGVVEILIGDRGDAKMTITVIDSDLCSQVLIYISMWGGGGGGGGSE